MTTIFPGPSQLQQQPFYGRFTAITRSTLCLVGSPVNGEFCRGKVLLPAAVVDDKRIRIGRTRCALVQFTCALCQRLYRPCLVFIYF